MAVSIGNRMNILVVTTFFCLWLTGYSSDVVEQYLALGLIFSFGILHGSNDISLLRKMRPGMQGPKGNLRIVAAYIGFVLLIALIFIGIPLLALLFFIAISSYHFGEQHWKDLTRATVPRKLLLYTSYGMAILFLLFRAHGPLVSETIEAISGYGPPTYVYDIGLWSSLSAFALALALNFNFRELGRHLPLQILLLGVFYIVFHTASLIWAFAIYFVLWHSIPSLMDQMGALYGKSSWENGLKYLKSSAVYWVAALVSLAVAFFVFRDAEYGFLPLFFSFLAAITFPHVLVMGQLYRN